MAHKINLDIARLDAYYENMMDDVYLDHHVYPTNLTRMNQTPDQLAEQAEADSYANNAARPARRGKKVIFQSDPDFCNGLPREQRGKR